MPRSITAGRLAATAVTLSLLAACAQTGTKVGDQNAGTYPDVQATAAGNATCYQTSAAENQALAQATSAARRANGLPAVTPDPALAKAAADHACDMAQRGRMTHVGTSTKGPMQRVKAKGYAPRLTAENIAAGPYDQTRVQREWARSSGHIANIMIPQVRDVGIGRAVGSDGRTVFWSAVYGAPR